MTASEVAVCKQIGILCAASSACKRLLGAAVFVALLHEVRRIFTARGTKTGRKQVGTVYTKKERKRAGKPCGSAAYRGHHGRQRPVGEKARSAAQGRPQGWRGDLPHDRDLLQGHRREVFYRLCVLYRKLEAAAGRSRRADEPVPRLSEGGGGDHVRAWRCGARSG